MHEQTETLGETVPETCPACGREPLAVVHDTAKATAGYEVAGSFCLVDGAAADTAFAMDDLYYVHE